jgi:hypothetical protein
MAEKNALSILNIVILARIFHRETQAFQRRIRPPSGRAETPLKDLLDNMKFLGWIA